MNNDTTGNTQQNEFNYTDDTQHNKDLSSFQYTINPNAGKVKQARGLGILMSPKYASKTKMYVMFVLGSLCLILISYMAVNGVSFYGNNTYIKYFQDYVAQNTDLAYTSFIIMVIINIFWILVNAIIEFLAINRLWIPPKPQNTTEVLSDFQIKKINTIFVSRYTFDEAGYRDMIRNRRKHDEIEDKEEFEAVLQNPLLSPLAYLWSGVKKVYRFLIVVPDILFLGWMRLLRWNEKIWFTVRENIAHTIELIIYFLNPLHLIEEVIDTAITVLVKVLYPAILTPVIFFVPVRYGLYIENVFHIILYFVLIGGLRIGVEFFSIYIRFLRNTRVV